MQARKQGGEVKFRAFDQAGLKTCLKSPVEVRLLFIADMQAFIRTKPGQPCGVAEDARVRLGIAGLAGDDDGLKQGQETEAFQDALQPCVKVGQDEKPEAASEFFKHLPHFRVGLPGLGPGKPGVEILEQRCHDLGWKPGSQGVGKTIIHQPRPPAAVAIVRWDAVMLGLRPRFPGSAEGGFKLLWNCLHTMTLRKAGIACSDGFLKMDQGAGGVEKHGLNLRTVEVVQAWLAVLLQVHFTTGVRTMLR